jgi:hypothetical protein
MNKITSSARMAYGTLKTEPDNSKISWDFQLSFEVPVVKAAPLPPPPPKIPPRVLLKDKFPRILERLELLWGTLELNKYFEQTLFTERSDRQGFPLDVMQALGEIHNEHRQILKLKKMIVDDVWDIQVEK